MFGEEPGKITRLGKTQVQRDFLDAQKGIGQIPAGFGQQFLIDEAERRGVLVLAADPVQLRGGDAKVFRVKRQVVLASEMAGQQAVEALQVALAAADR